MSIYFIAWMAYSKLQKNVTQNSPQHFFQHGTVYPFWITSYTTNNANYLTIAKQDKLIYNLCCLYKTDNASKIGRNLLERKIKK